MPRSTNFPVRNTCQCSLTTRLPLELEEWWRPDLDDEPEPEVQAVARYGEDPTLRRAVRTDHGWIEKGSLVEPAQNTPPIPWAWTGRCQAGTWHVVVACQP